MKIVRVDTTLLSVPFARPVQVSTMAFTKRDVVIVEIHTDEGVSGMGYLGVLGRGSETIKTCIDKDVADLLMGENPLYRNKIWDKMWWALNWIGRKGIAVYALSAIDVALWDLAGKVQNTSLHMMLGPATDRVKAYASAGFLAYSADELVEEALRYVDRGFRAYKMKVGMPDWRADLTRVSAVRSALKSDIDLMVDANQGLDVATAILMGRELEQMGIYWFEEPVPADDIIGHAQIAHALDVRVATGETEFSRFGFRELLDRKAADIWQIDVRAGGITEWMRIAGMASAARIPVTPHMAWEIQIHMTAAVDNGLYVEYMDWFDDLFEELPPIVEGMVVAPDRPGHGLRFKEEVLSRYRVD